MKASSISKLISVITLTHSTNVQRLLLTILYTSTNTLRDSSTILYPRSTTTTVTMQFTTQLVSLLLLAAPTLISAAPATEINGDALVARTAEEYGASATDYDFTRRAVELLFARDGETCNAPRPTEAAAAAKYDQNRNKMSEATKKAHEGQTKCPSTSRTDFQKSKDQKKRKEVKNKCLTGYRT